MPVMSTDLAVTWGPGTRLSTRLPISIVSCTFSHSLGIYASSLVPTACLVVVAVLGHPSTVTLRPLSSPPIARLLFSRSLSPPSVSYRLCPPRIHLLFFQCPRCL